jgi:hypothetical protein
MEDIKRLETLVLGNRFTIAFRWPEAGYSFVGKALQLVLDHTTLTHRIKFTETGCTKTVNGTTTTIDSTAVVITDSNQRISWTRDKDFAINHMPAGVYRGYVCWGADASNRDKYVDLQLEVALPKPGAL